MLFELSRGEGKAECAIRLHVVMKERTLPVHDTKERQRIFVMDFVTCVLKLTEQQ